jgi:hypothetical protein
VGREREQKGERGGVCGAEHLQSIILWRMHSGQRLAA